MRNLYREIRVELWSFSELPADEQKLIYKAALVRRNAQAHLSHYFVGAAVRSAATGRIYVGVNVENSAYTPTTHAEQVAICSMIAAEGPAKIEAMAILAGPEGEEPEIVGHAETDPDARVDDFCFACGLCLQIAWENCMADPNVVLLHLTPWGEVARTTIGDAFPMRFGPESLGVSVMREHERGRVVVRGEE